MKEKLHLILVWVLTFFWACFALLALSFLVIGPQLLDGYLELNTAGGFLFILFPIIAALTFALLVYFNVFIYTSRLRYLKLDLVVTSKLRLLIVIMILGLVILSLYQLFSFSGDLEFELKKLNESLLGSVVLYTLQTLLLIKLLNHKINILPFV